MKLPHRALWPWAIYVFGVLPVLFGYWFARNDGPQRDSILYVEFAQADPRLPSAFTRDELQSDGKNVRIRVPAGTDAAAAVAAFSEDLKLRFGGQSPPEVARHYSRPAGWLASARAAAPYAAAGFVLALAFSLYSLVGAQPSEDGWRKILELAELAMDRKLSALERRSDSKLQQATQMLEGAIKTQATVAAEAIAGVRNELPKLREELEDRLKLTGMRLQETLDMALDQERRERDELLKKLEQDVDKKIRGLQTGLRGAVSESAVKELIAAAVEPYTTQANGLVESIKTLQSRVDLMKKYAQFIEELETREQERRERIGRAQKALAKSKSARLAGLTRKTTGAEALRAILGALQDNRQDSATWIDPVPRDPDRLGASFLERIRCAQEEVERPNRVVLVLRGPAGTGKSAVAAHLEKFYEGVEVIPVLPSQWHPEGTFDAIVDAVVKSWLEDKTYWLRFDELSTARNLLEAFGPAMETLLPRNAETRHLLIPMPDGELVKLPVPANFRIIVTMNTAGLDALRHSALGEEAQWLRRVNTVDFGPLTMAEERALFTKMPAGPAKDLVFAMVGEFREIGKDAKLPDLLEGITLTHALVQALCQPKSERVQAFLNVAESRVYLPLRRHLDHELQDKWTRFEAKYGPRAMKKAIDELPECN